MQGKDCLEFLVKDVMIILKQIYIKRMDISDWIHLDLDMDHMLFLVNKLLDLVVP
jgi:hypothetical protein